MNLKTYSVIGGALLAAVILIGCSPANQPPTLEQIRGRVRGELRPCPDDPDKLCPFVGDDDRPVTVMGGSVLLTGGPWKREMESGDTKYFEYLQTTGGSTHAVIDAVRYFIVNEKPGDTDEDSTFEMSPTADSDLKIEVFKGSSKNLLYTLQRDKNVINLRLVPDDKKFAFKRFLKFHGEALQHVKFYNVLVSIDPDATTFGCKADPVGPPYDQKKTIDCAPTLGAKQSIGFEVLFK